MHNSQEYQPSTCSSTTLLVEAGGLKGGLWISRLTHVMKATKKTFLRYLNIFSQGGILMPLFFLLSGFALARSYGPRISAPEAKYQHNKFKLCSSGNRIPLKTSQNSEHDSFSEFWLFRQTPKEFFSLFFFKARLGKPDLQRVIILYGILFLQSKPLSWPFYITRAINGLNNKALFLDNFYRIILTDLF